MARHVLFACFASAALLGCNAASSVTEVAHVQGIQTPPAQGTLLILDGLSVINTQKTLLDHVIGWASGNDCSTVRASRGEKYCEEPPKPVPMMVRTSYCYKSLAAVSCYDKPLEQDTSRLLGTRVDNIPITAR